MGSLLACGIWDPSAPVRRCLCEHHACAFQLMTGNGGLPHSKTKHQEMRRRSDERQKCLRKMLNGERTGRRAEYAGGQLPTVLEILAWFWKLGQKTCCGLGLDFVLPASSSPFSALMVPERLLPLALPEDPLSSATFSLPAKLSVK